MNKKQEYRKGVMRNLKVLFLIAALIIILLTGIASYKSEGEAVKENFTADLTDKSAEWIWTDVELNGMGWITGLVVCPAPPYQIYARSDVGGVYRYNRQTARWIQLLDSFGLDDRNVYSVDGLAVDPVNGNTLYFAGNSTDASGEIWKSADAGRTWQPTGLREKAKVYMGGNDDYRSDVGERIAVDPNNAGVIYFGSRKDGLWRKFDRQPWEKVSALPSSSSAPGYTYIAFDKNGGTVNVNGNTVTKIFYAGAYLNEDGSGANGVYKTTDGGVSFVKMTGTGSYAQKPLRAAVNSDGVFVTTVYQGILRGTRNSGELASVIIADNGISGLSVSSDGKSFAALGNAKEHPVYISDNAGLNWLTKGQRNRLKIPYQNDDWCHPERGGYIIDPVDPSGKTAFAGTGFGVIKTVNLSRAENEIIWDDHTQGMSILCVNTVKAAPVKDGHDLHAAVLDMGGFSIKDITKVPQGRLAANNAGTFNVEWNVPLTGITGMDYSYRSPNNMVYTGWHEFGYYTDYALKFGTTTDGGNTWTEISIPQARKRAAGLGQFEAAGAIAMSSVNPDNIVYSPAGGFVRYSMDMGKSWNDSSAAIARGVNTKFFMDASLNAMYERIMPYWTAQNIASDKINGNVFYLFTVRNGITSEFWRSEDGGKTWRRTYAGNTSNGIDSTALPFTNVRVNPAKEGDVFVAIKPGHDGEDSKRPFDYKPLWRSTDKTCADFKKVPGVQYAIDVAFGKGDSPDVPYIYIYGKITGDNVFGVYLSKDDAKSWIRVTGEHQQFGKAQGLEADMRYKNRVFLYTGGRGIICGQSRDFSKN
ncbi:MAG: hypothetical protein FWC22_05005 [Treponema sp.]|nr:hypothetical protein [Treponema sp.]